MHLSIFILYFFVLFLVIFFSYKRQKTNQDFIIGNRNLNFWLTALSAHASDMSSWLFLAYPAKIFLFGTFHAWTGIGLTVFMYLNWQFIAPKIRIATEQSNSLTLSGYFENRFADTSHALRTISGIMTLVFFIIYICSGLVAMGYLVEILFSIDYVTGITLGLFLVMLYVFLGGYTTIAWVDLFQGFFLLAVVVVLPICLFWKIGGSFSILSVIEQKQLNLSLFPSFSFSTFYQILLLSAGWGLGYLGQPHIITKFMGIKNVQEIRKSKFLGISWQALALLGATAIGLIGIGLFPDSIPNPELIFVESVKNYLPPIFTGLVLCAIMAAITNVMAAQILVVASVVTEDFYKKCRKKTSTKELLWTSRLSVIAISILSYFIAYFKISSIYKLVLFAWTGLGASFGPLLLLSLYCKKVNKYGAFAGIATGGILAAFIPYLSTLYNITLPTMLIAFIMSGLAILFVSYLTKNKNEIIALDN